MQLMTNICGNRKERYICINSLCCTSWNPLELVGVFLFIVVQLHSGGWAGRVINGEPTKKKNTIQSLWEQGACHESTSHQQYPHVSIREKLGGFACTKQSPQSASHAMMSAGSGMAWVVSTGAPPFGT